ARGGERVGLKPTPTETTNVCPSTSLDYTRDKSLGTNRPLSEIRKHKETVWEAIISHSARVKAGEFLTLNGKGEGFKILKKGEGKAIVEVESEGDVFEKYGTVPIPPYLERPAEKEDEVDYQTVFARTPGASAAPTAGLHFTPELLDKIKSKGVEIAYLSLLVGPGTFEPIRTEGITQHKMHKEYFEIGEETCAKINAAKKSGKKIWAVGTTVVKALETAARMTSPLRLRSRQASVPLHIMERDEKNAGATGRSPSPLHPVERGPRGEVSPFRGDSDLFIHPPFDFKIVDGLITNFHWPRSTLILLVAAFAGKDQILFAYREAIARRYRFFSYGDAMLIY
ncbi:MAG: S-adenosylmethionine:tRNA ribosyltransferase-isomerase, partial [Limisphaerales bacterium]